MCSIRTKNNFAIEKFFKGVVENIYKSNQGCHVKNKYK